MTAIDFRQLLKEERQRAKKGNSSSNKRSENDKKERKEDNGRSDDVKKEEKPPTKISSKQTSNSANENTSGNNNIDDMPEWTNLFIESFSLHMTRCSDDSKTNNEPLAHLESFDPVKHVLAPDVLKSVFYVSRFVPIGYQEKLLTWLQALPKDRPGGGDGSKQKQQQPQGCWISLTKAPRRVALFDASSSSSSSSRSHSDECEIRAATTSSEKLSLLLPPPLQVLANQLVSAGIFPEELKPNHVLVNEYQPGQGIMPHTDGHIYHPQTATISIGGGDVLLKFTKRLSSNEIGQNKATTTTATAATTENILPLPPSSFYPLSLLLEGHGSLVVFSHDAYTKYCHSIDEGVLVEQVMLFPHSSPTTTRTTCVNAGNRKTITRRYRISLTFRHKYET